MNQKEIMALKAGPDLNEIVAEKLLGLNIVTFLGHRCIMVDVNEGYSIPKYSTSWDGAWGLVRLMEDKGFEVRMENTIFETMPTLYFVEFDSGGKDGKNGSISTQSIHESICKAALLALEV